MTDTHAPSPLDQIVVDMRRAGHTYLDIVEETGMSQPNVSHTIARWAPELIKSRIGGVDKDDVAQRYTAGETVTELALAYSVSRQRISQIIKERHVQGARRAALVQRAVDAAEAAVDAYREGASIDALAHEFDVPKRFLKHEVSKEITGHERMRKADFDALIQMYRDGAYEVEIAEKFGMTQSNVSSIVHRHAPDAVAARRDARRASVPEEYRRVGPGRGKVDPLKVVAALRRGEDREALRVHVGLSPAGLRVILCKHAPDLINARGWPKGRARVRA